MYLLDILGFIGKFMAYLSARVLRKERKNWGIVEKHFHFSPFIAQWIRPHSCKKTVSNLRETLLQAYLEGDPPSIFGLHMKSTTTLF
jgi:hypothetical protein